MFDAFTQRFPSDLAGQKHHMLVVFLGLMGINSLIFYFVPSPFPETFKWVYLLCTCGLWCLLCGYLFAKWPMKWVVHGTLMLGYGLVLSVTLGTGGIHSPKLVYLTLLPIPAVFFLGPKAAIVWASVGVATTVTLAWSTAQGVLAARVAFSRDDIGWALMSHATLMLSLVMIPMMYHGLHRRQIAEVKRGNEALEKARQALIEAESYKDEFVAGVGHELRTPMNAILGFNDVLRTEVKDDSKALITVDLIRESTERLLKLTNHILDFSQLQAGRLQLQMKPMHVLDALHLCVALFAREADSRVRFVTYIAEDLPEWILSDHIRLKEVICHLLENAFKFTEQGQVMLRVRRSQQSLQFDVVDTGVGVPAELQRIIFNRFEHADAETQRQFGGAGLGLSICERLVHLFGGEIGMQSRLGEGAHFWFHVPCLPCAPPTRIQPSTPAGMGEKFCLLLVDDNAVNLQVALHFCRTLWPQATVLTARSGKSCLDLLATLTVDMVLMDMIMPDMDGAQATREIRTQLPAPTCHTPIIGLTASTHPSDIAACFEAGMDDVMHKPIDKSRLRACIEGILNDRKVMHDT